eukprot:COSAG01_NODE_41_length_32446_cov_41.218877_22_plen_357_part_00
MGVGESERTQTRAPRAWTRHTRDPGVSEAALALAKAQKSGGDSDMGTEATTGRSMSDSVDSLLARPARHDAATTSAEQGFQLAPVTSSRPPPMQAMLHSRVVCPVISATATQRMESMVPPPQSGKVVLFSSSPGWDIQTPPRDVMQMLEALCKSKTGLYMGYDWKGSTSGSPEDEDEARRKKGMPPIDWSCNEEGNPTSVATSQWFVGYKSKIKSQLVLFAQLPGTAEIECATVDGGAISQLELRTMPQLLEEATQDIKSKNLPVPVMYIKQRRTVDEVVVEYGSQADIEAFETRYHTKINRPGQAAAKSDSGSTGALDLLLVEWVLAIELEQLGHVLTVLPILVGERTGTHCYHS